MTKNDISAWLSQAARQLTYVSSTPNLEAQIILAEVLQQPREWILTHPDSQIPEFQKSQAESLLHRYLAGEPLPYILQRQEFFGLPFRVTPDVLIPRPETELLVDYALVWLNSHQIRNLVVDVGTGSGCIAVSLAVKSLNLNILAVDRSFLALEVAKFNAQQHQVVDRIQFIQSDLLSATFTQFDLICANLPYIPSKTLAQLAVAQHEPLSALDGGPDGLRLIAALLKQAKNQVTPGGMILLEIESTQGISALALAQSQFVDADIHVLPDLAGHPRLLTIQTRD